MHRKINNLNHTFSCSIDNLMLIMYVNLLN